MGFWNPNEWLYWKAVISSSSESADHPLSSPPHSIQSLFAIVVNPGCQLGRGCENKHLSSEKSISFHLASPPSSLSSSSWHFAIMPSLLSPQVHYLWICKNGRLSLINSQRARKFDSDIWEMWNLCNLGSRRNLQSGFIQSQLRTSYQLTLIQKYTGVWFNTISKAQLGGLYWSTLQYTFDYPSCCYKSV